MRFIRIASTSVEKGVVLQRLVSLAVPLKRLGLSSVATSLITTLGRTGHSHIRSLALSGLPLSPFRTFALSDLRTLALSHFRISATCKH